MDTIGVGGSGRGQGHHGRRATAGAGEIGAEGSSGWAGASRKLSKIETAVETKIIVEGVRWRHLVSFKGGQGGGGYNARCHPSLGKDDACFSYFVYLGGGGRLCARQQDDEGRTIVGSH